MYQSLCFDYAFVYRFSAIEDCILDYKTDLLLAVDHTRVQLRDTAEDYINANIISSQDVCTFLEIKIFCALKKIII